MSFFGHLPESCVTYDWKHEGTLACVEIQETLLEHTLMLMLFTAFHSGHFPAALCSSQNWTPQDRDLD